MKNNEKPKIVLITTFGGKVGDTFLGNLVKILAHCSKTLNIIGPVYIPNNYQNVNIHPIKYLNQTNLFFKIINVIITEFKAAFEVLKLGPGFDRWLFFGGETLLIPMLLIKLFKGHSTLILAGSLENESNFKYKLFYQPLILAKRINCHITNKIVVYSHHIISLWNMEKYRAKIAIAHEHFIDFSLFNIKKPFSQREKLVGFVGRFEKEKGILEFLESLPILINKIPSYNYLIIGDGHLMSSVKEIIKDVKMSERITIVGWVNHQELPNYLNRINLLVMPSYTEGLPNIMLESMACGTPVLATPVGAIPDIIKDGETGFLLEDNSPKCIEKNIIRILSNPNLEQISKNGYDLIQNQYTFEKAVDSYNAIIY